MATTVGVLLVSPIFFPHYLGNVAVPLALLAGVVAGVITLRPDTTDGELPPRSSSASS